MDAIKPIFLACLKAELVSGNVEKTFQSELRTYLHSRRTESAQQINLRPPSPRPEGAAAYSCPPGRDTNMIPLKDKE